MLTVDVFVRNPIPFAICSIGDLIALKQQAGRPQDLIDIEKLRRIQEKRKRDER